MNIARWSRTSFVGTEKSYSKAIVTHKSPTWKQFANINKDLRIARVIIFKNAAFRFGFNRQNKLHTTLDSPTALHKEKFIPSKIHWKIHKNDFNLLKIKVLLLYFFSIKLMSYVRSNPYILTLQPVFHAHLICRRKDDVFGYVLFNFLDHLKSFSKNCQLHQRKKTNSIMLT